MPSGHDAGPRQPATPRPESALVVERPGHRPTPLGASHYGASKSALEALTRSWAIELAPMGILWSSRQL